MLTMTSN